MAFYVYDLGLTDIEKFWRLTYQEFWILVLSYHKQVEQKQQERKDELWRYGDLKAHIANCTTVKKGGGWWTYSDFVRLPGENKEVTDVNKILKEAKQKLGSKFNPNAN